MADTLKPILLTLDDAKSQQLAHALSNKTAQRILDYIANNPKTTQTQIIKDLQLPQSTVHYNLNLLKTVGLVNNDEFHYSPKGRQVDHFTLTNRIVIVAPHRGILDDIRNILPVSLIAIAATALFNWWNTTTTPPMAMRTEMVLLDTAATTTPTQPSTSLIIIITIMSMTVLYLLMRIIVRTIAYHKQRNRTSR